MGFMKRHVKVELQRTTVSGQESEDRFATDAPNITELCTIGSKSCPFEKVLIRSSVNPASCSFEHLFGATDISNFFSSGTTFHLQLL